MEVYRFKVKNLRVKEAVDKIIRELKKIYAVKLVEVNLENSQVKIIMDEIGSIFACETALSRLGYPVVRLEY